MSTPANVSIVTLGVEDLTRSIAFYDALGWERRGNPADGICWFKTASCWIGLFGRDALSEDIGLTSDGEPSESLPEYRGITLAINVNSETEVDAGFHHALSVGAGSVKPPTRMTWGGYSSYFADPDGHIWEIAYAPGFHVAADGTIDIN